MKRRSRIAGFLTICLLLLSGRAFAVQGTLIADTHVNAALPAVNSGAISNIAVGNGFTGLLQFDLGTLPASTTAAQISRATLLLYVNRVDTPGLVSLAPLTGAWSEYGVTYATLPGIGSAAQLFNVAQPGMYVAVDVTSLVQGWVTAPASNYGVALTAGTAVGQFDSKENDLTGHAALLDISIVSQGPAGATGPAGPMGPLGPVGAAGPAGPQGLQGLAGAAGVAGAKGATGASGPQGPAGPQGPPGPAGAAGFSYQGTYSSSANYALDDMVLFNGSSYVSLIAANHGNTPDGSAADWGLLAQGAASGSSSAGSTSLAVTYGGTYSSATNYALNEIVAYNGSSYLSLLASNHGNTPDLNPLDWGLLASGGTGAPGPQGPAGPAGPQGAPGAVGLTLQGVYQASANYSLGDGVLFNGSGYVSLIANNHGNTPDASTTDWAEFAQGGTPGPQGSPGLAYRGAYASASNYALGDVVLWQGSSYASLITANHGNTPDASPQQWGLLAAQGPGGATGATGATGVAGPQGTPGSTGPPGEKGDQGPQGIAGQAGAQGIPGAAGAQGASGPAGAQGPAGPVGLAFQGAYQSTANYTLGDGVIFNGSGYVSLGTSNHGNTPDASPADWALFASGGQNGAQGLPGLVYKGAYASAANYALGDVVFWQGSSYASLTASNHGNPPDASPQQWGPLAAQGFQGPAGVAGAAGPAGPQGVIGQTGPPGAKGDSGAQGIAGQAGAQGLIGPAGPQGATGPAGAQGAPGPVGLTFQGNYNASANYALGDGVGFNGSGYISLSSGNHGNTPGASPAAWALLAAAGAGGAAGASGPAGATGATGAQGPAGPVGLQGPQGVQGAQGPAGVHFAGSYSSAAGYGIGDAVSFNGSSYLSFVAGNQGQTPGLSPGYWAVLAAQGASGSPGAQGPAGPAGATGATGSVGAVGPQGPPIAFRGGWSASQGYATGDTVSYSGSSYIAAAGNNGRQPDVSPLYWSILAASGAAGPQGPAGATGAQGPTGYPGPAGATGASGPTGPAGPAGATGATGATGPAGSAGPAGATGPAGLVYRGAYSSSQTYAPNDAVSFAGSTFLSLAAGNTGNTPGAAPAFWSLLAAQGATGASGPQGPQGVAGAAGLQGPAGPAGASGPQGPAGPAGAAGTPGAAGPVGPAGAAGVNGLTYRGAFSSSATYALNDGVTLGGATYISLAPNNTGNGPAGSPSFWALLAAAGSAGPAGPAGPTGTVGPAGPVGATGAQGPAGATGSTGINFRGAWTSTLSYAPHDAVTFDGSLYLALAANTSAEPDTSVNLWAVLASAGATGPAGSAGAPATVAVGSVTTGAPGSSASVTNSGTANAAVLNFTLPQGAPGTGGSSGGGSSATVSSSGIPFIAMYHSVSYAATFYSLTNTNQAATETPAELTWVPNGCTATTLTVFSLQNAAITVTLRTGATPASLTNTTLSCQASTGQSCTASGSVSVPAGGFADLTITHPDSNPTGVWAALSCN